jgi:hypothetical protein
LTKEQTIIYNQWGNQEMPMRKPEDTNGGNQKIPMR